jgi:hypothetical protein
VRPKVSGFFLIFFGSDLWFLKNNLQRPLVFPADS